jgi:diguanylate cyclase
VLYALSEPFDLAGNEVEIGASIGIALRPNHGTTLHDLMRAADAAMYHAKGSGRGRAEHFTETLAAQLADRARLESDLREAIDGDQFMLVFQPQVGMADGRIVAAEALLRWQHPRDGLRLPGTFIDRAEETGLIVEIGEWVIRTVAETIARWGRMGIEQRLAINISPRQLDHAGFFRKLRAAMHAASAPARLLELEITETLAMHCNEDVIEAIATLRADGATIAVDDFGTGYSNLARLRALPVDRVKLDRSLIAPIAESADARTIAQAVIGLVHGLGCEAVGEGIETQAQADVLRVIGCDVIQGYAIAQPMAEDDFIAWTRRDDRMALRA